jgi:hypothetical protein
MTGARFSSGAVMMGQRYETAGVSPGVFGLMMAAGAGNVRAMHNVRRARNRIGQCMRCLPLPADV